MPNTGWLSFNTFADDPVEGTVTWSSPGNAQTVNGLYAQAIISTGNSSHRLKCTGPNGLSIPSGSSIQGIEIQIDRISLSGAGLSVVTNAKLYKAGTLAGFNNVDVANWPTSPTFFTLGAPNDNWGLGWDTSDFGANFGVGITVAHSGTAMTAGIDAVQVRITYSSGMFFVL